MESAGHSEEAGRAVVLVAEDDVLIRLCMAEYLRDSGYTVVEACNGDEAIAVFAARAVDVVFSDVRMPGATDGAKLALWVRENRPDTHVILSSGYFPKARDEGGNNVVFIPKPYEPETVAQTIRAELRKEVDAKARRSVRNWRLREATEDRR